MDVFKFLFYSDNLALLYRNINKPKILINLDQHLPTKTAGTSVIQLGTALVYAGLLAGI